MPKHTLVTTQGAGGDADALSRIDAYSEFAAHQFVLVDRKDASYFRQFSGDEDDDLLGKIVPENGGKLPVVPDLNDCDEAVRCYVFAHHFFVRKTGFPVADETVDQLQRSCLVLFLHGGRDEIGDADAEHVKEDVVPVDEGDPGQKETEFAEHPG